MTCISFEQMLRDCHEDHTDLAKGKSHFKSAHCVHVGSHHWNTIIMLLRIPEHKFTAQVHLQHAHKMNTK